jgi:hypothetical protein
MVIKVDIDDTHPDLTLENDNVEVNDVSLADNPIVNSYNKWVIRLIFYLLMLWILTLLFREITFLSDIKN